MRLLRIGDSGREVPCVLDADGVARDVSTVVADFTPETIPGVIEALSGADLAACPAVPMDGARIGTPMAQPRNIYCIGLNYSDHAAEAGLPIPGEPILFNKASGTFCGPNDNILFSPKMTKLDWEVELGVVIGRPALNIEKDAALDHVLGYTLVNDVSERAWQIEREGQWAKGKGFPNFCPTGPWIVTGDEVGDAKALDMWLDVNGTRMQTGTTSTMIFDVATIVSYLSEFMRLEPGDLICTGTPPGVGLGMETPRYLKVGDKVTLGVEGLGEQAQEVVPLWHGPLDRAKVMYPAKNNGRSPGKDCRVTHFAHRLTDKTAVVTAAGQGIGRAVAERLIAEGAQVHASDLVPAPLDSLGAAGTAGLDATDPDAIAAYFDRFDRIDILVHCVGYVHQGTIEECSPDDWRHSMTISLDSAYHVFRAALPHMKEAGGNIVTIASVVSSIKGFPRRAAYGTAKAGLIGLVKSIAADYLQDGIRANAVCPGTVDSPSLRGRIDELAETFGSREKAEAFFIDRQPTGRFGTPEEIAGLCAYLASDESALINGQAIAIDGGIMI